MSELSMLTQTTTESDRSALLETEVERLRNELAVQQRHNDTLQAQVEHRQRQIDAMRRTSDGLFALASVDTMLRETLVLAVDVLHADAGSILLHSPGDDTFLFRHVLGPAAPRLNGLVMPASRGIPGACCVRAKRISPMTRRMRKIYARWPKSAATWCNP